MLVVSVKIALRCILHYDCNSEMVVQAEPDRNEGVASAEADSDFHGRLSQH
jgi:hypothetical protein